MPEEARLALALAGVLLKCWYPMNGQSSLIVQFLVRDLGIPGGQILPGICQYMHLMGGDHSRLPQPVQDFLRESQELLHPILSIFLRDGIKVSITTKVVAAPTIRWLEDMVATHAILPLISPMNGAEFENEVRQVLRVAVIPEDVDARALKYIHDREVTERHPAYDFLYEIHSHAQGSRARPARAIELVGLLGPLTN